MLTLDDILDRFGSTMEDFEKGQHDTWAQAEIIECMQRIGQSLTSERVTEEIRLLPGSILPLPPYFLRHYSLMKTTGHHYAGHRKVSNLFHLSGYLFPTILMDYERLALNAEGQLELEPTIEPALMAYLEWKWMKLRPMKDQVGELRKGSLALVAQLQRDAFDLIAEVRGQINLNKHTSAVMSGVASVRNTRRYRNS